MNSNAKIVSVSLKYTEELETLLLKMLSACTAGEAQDASTRLIQYITKAKDLQREDRLKNSEKETVTFYEWVKEQAKSLKMIETSHILNSQAWKIHSLKLFPGLGIDPETEWTGFLRLWSSDNETELPFEFYEDDYRSILKQVAVIVQAYNIGE